jgi:hypothetical protein
MPYPCERTSIALARTSDPFRGLPQLRSKSKHLFRAPAALRWKKEICQHLVTLRGKAKWQFGYLIRNAKLQWRGLSSLAPFRDTSRRLNDEDEAFDGQRTIPLPPSFSLVTSHDNAAFFAFTIRNNRATAMMSMIY